jgi:hypothetical protein
MLGASSVDTTPLAPSFLHGSRGIIAGASRARQAALSPGIGVFRFANVGSIPAAASAASTCQLRLKHSDTDGVPAASPSRSRPLRSRLAQAGVSGGTLSRTEHHDLIGSPAVAGRRLSREHIEAPQQGVKVSA